jgi:membrane associated rhomboid family serine protease
MAPEALAEAGTYANPADGFERGLVVLSMGLSYWLVPASEGYRLLVESRFAEPVREEISCFEREKVGWPPRPVVPHSSKWGRAMLTPFLWALAVLAVFDAQSASPGRWEALEALDARAVFHDGQVWRAATALFLHWDLEHLISNLVAGVFVFTSVISVVGVLRGWLLLFLASTAGNLAVATVHYPGPYRSLGASTAIFAGLGLLTGRAIRGIIRTQGPRHWRPVLIPLASGAVLLAWFGAGGVDTDVPAHAAGFAAGLILGYLAAGPIRVGNP